VSALRLTGAPTGPGAFSVPSRSAPGTVRAVVWGPPYAECDCPGWVYRKSCWHLGVVAAEVELEQIRKELACE